MIPYFLVRHGRVQGAYQINTEKRMNFKVKLNRSYIQVTSIEIAKQYDERKELHWDVT